jgi:hypothetical protein
LDQLVALDDAAARTREEREAVCAPHGMACSTASQACASL